MKGTTCRGTYRSLKSYKNLDSQIVLDEKSLTRNGTTWDQVDPAQVQGWKIAINDALILDKERGKDQTRIFTSKGKIDPNKC